MKNKLPHKKMGPLTSGSPKKWRNSGYTQAPRMWEVSIASDIGEAAQVATKLTTGAVKMWQGGHLVLYRALNPKP